MRWSVPKCTECGIDIEENLTVLCDDCYPNFYCVDCDNCNEECDCPKENE